MQGSVPSTSQTHSHHPEVGRGLATDYPGAEEASMEKLGEVHLHSRPPLNSSYHSGQDLGRAELPTPQPRLGVPPFLLKIWETLMP